MAEWRRGGPTLALVLVEIDDFTTHTRTYGPKVRDLLVVSLARIVFAEVREMDMVARYNTVCLGFFLPGAELADALRVAERIREAASRATFPFSGSQLSYTVSAGLISAAGGEDMVSMFRKAESALEAAHQHGGNCLFHHDGRQQQLAAAEAVGA